MATEAKARESLVGSDIYWLAKGYWERYFNNLRMHPKTKAWAIATAVALAATIMAGVINSVTDVYSVSPAPVGAQLMFVVPSGIGVACAIIFIAVYSREKQEFINRMVDRWESGDRRIPGEQDVLEYVNVRR